MILEEAVRLYELLNGFADRRGPTLNQVEIEEFR